MSTLPSGNRSALVLKVQCVHVSYHQSMTSDLLLDHTVLSLQLPQWEYHRQLPTPSHLEAESLSSCDVAHSCLPWQSKCLLLDHTIRPLPYQYCFLVPHQQQVSFHLSVGLQYGLNALSASSPQVTSDPRQDHRFQHSPLELRTAPILQQLVPCRL